MKAEKKITQTPTKSEEVHEVNPRVARLRFLVAILIAGLIGYGIGVSKIAFEWQGYKPHLEITSKEPPPSVSNVDFSQFWLVLDKIENNYYDKKAIDPQKVLNGAITGMVSSLDDPYTMYLPPKQNDDFKDGMAGKFEGIGAELGMKNKQIIIVSPIDGSPAKKAGIKAGDTILKVNNQSVAGWSLNQTVDKIRGKKGTEVTLNILHKDAEKPVDIKITRDTITVKSLTSWTKPVKEVESINKDADGLSQKADDKIVYIRLSQFGDSTNKEWSDLALKVNEEIQKDPSIKGIVFDLRNNPGGYLNDAVYIASEFVKDGTAVMQEDKNGNRESYPVSGNGILTEIPLVVLINKGSASAAEIVSGALRDHGRALLVGETSFGKGTIQQAEDFGGGSGLHVTIAKWLTPNGTWVGNGKNGKGLEPDVVVSIDEKNPDHDAQLEKAIETVLNN
jgi:carboxyl-terminal processing protease